MTQPPGPAPYDPANPGDGSQAPYGAAEPGGSPQHPSGGPGVPAGEPYPAGPYGSPQASGQPPYAGQPGYGGQPYTGQPQSPGPPPYAAGAYPASAYAPPYYPKNSLAVWSLVLGIASFVLSCGFVTGIPAVIVGNAAKRAVAEGQADNEGMATAGIVLGWVAIGLSAVGLLLLLVFFPALFAWVGTIPDQS